MTTKVRLAGVSLDCPDAARLASFYREFLSLELVYEEDDFVAMKSGDMYLTTMQVDDFRAPSWPEGDSPKQLHLEISVDDLEASETRAVGLGATKPVAQPSPDRWRVLLDPVGHPFCITTMIPD